MFDNPFSMVVAIVAMVMIARVLTAKYRHERLTGESAQRPDPEAARLREEVKALKERVAVLERLATDSSTALEREFDKLRSAD
jgi:hypothetical protein